MMAAKIQHVPIGECVEPIKTWNPARESNESTFRYIDIGGVSQYEKTIMPNGEMPTAEAPSRARQLVAFGDVLVSTVRPNLNAVAFVPKDLSGATASTGFCVLRPTPSRLCGRYLFHWVRTQNFVANMVKQATGQSYPAVSDKIVKSSKLPLPPLEEQKRIAAILDQADFLHRARRRAIERLRMLSQSIFYEMFGNPSSWKCSKLMPLQQLAVFKGGGTPKKTIKEYYTGDIPWVTPKDMKTWDIWTSIDKITDEAVENSSTNLIPANSILIVNRSGILKHTLPIGINRIPVTINQDMKALICNEGIHADFLGGLLKALEPEVLKWVRATTADNFPIDNLKEVLVPRPDEDVQLKYANIIENIRDQINLFVKASSASTDLFASLQKRAFRGEL